MLRRIIAVIAGLLIAFLIMMVLEYVNSLIFPFPPGTDLSNLEAVRAFAKTMPWTAYILVIAGWLFGSFFAGFAATKYEPNGSRAVCWILGILLTMGGVANFIMLEHPIWLMVLGVLIFLPMPIAGNMAAKDQGGK